MAVRVIHYNAADREEHGDLALRRNSFISESDDFNFNDIFQLDKNHTGWILTPLDVEGKPLFDVNGALISEPIEISNGFNFNSEGDYYKIVSEFDKAPIATSTKALNYLTVTIVAIILFLEVAIVFTLPQQISGDTSFNREIMIQRCETEIDAIRRKLKKSKSDNSALHRQAIVFVQTEMNRVSEFFRENRFQLSADQLELFYANLAKYSDIQQQLDSGLDFYHKAVPSINNWLETNLK